MIALIAGEAKEAFFENGVLAVPQCQRKAQPLMVVGNPGQAIFAPAIGPGTRLVVRKKVPGGAVGAIVFTDCAPLAFREDGPQRRQ